MADHEIIDPALYRAILHGIAAGACRRAAHVDRARAGEWIAKAEAQRFAVVDLLHQAASPAAEPSARVSRRCSATRAR